MNDSVSHPKHYTSGNIEVWDFIVDQKLDYLRGNIIKYVCRAAHKGSELEDLRKARAYLDRAIKELNDQNAHNAQTDSPFVGIGTSDSKE